MAEIRFSLEICLYFMLYFKFFSHFITTKFDSTEKSRDLGGSEFANPAA